MQVIVDVLSAISDAIIFVIDFVISIFEDIVFIVQLGAQMLSEIPSYFAWLPGEAVTLVVLAITIVFIYRIAGRS